MTLFCGYHIWLYYSWMKVNENEDDRKKKT